MVITSGHPKRINNCLRVGCCDQIGASQHFHEGETLWFSAISNSSFSSYNNIDHFFPIDRLASRLQTLRNNSLHRFFLHRNLSKGIWVQWGCITDEAPQCSSESVQKAEWQNLTLFNEWHSYYEMDLQLYSKNFVLNHPQVWLFFLPAMTSACNFNETVRSDTQVFLFFESSIFKFVCISSNSTFSPLLLEVKNSNS